MAYRGYHGGLIEHWWDFRAVCGAEGADSPAPLLSKDIGAWSPRAALRPVYGDRTEAAFSVCRNWAGDDQETLKTAVSAACEWGLGHDLTGKPAAYVRKSLARDLSTITQRESLDTWVYARKGQRCPACGGKGFDDGGPCQFCETTGTLQKRRWVRRNKQVPLVHVMDEDEEELDTPDLTDPARSRYDPDYQRSAIIEGSPETVVNDAPPPATEQAVQQMAANLLSRYTHERIDTVGRRGAIYVLVDGVSYRDAAKRITAEGHPISYVGLRDKLSRADRAGCAGCPDRIGWAGGADRVDCAGSPDRIGGASQAGPSGLGGPVDGARQWRHGSGAAIAFQKGPAGRLPACAPEPRSCPCRALLPGSRTTATIDI